MPTYIYKFVETGETIEVQQAFTDATLTEATHPATGQVLPVKKVFTPVGVTFKGGGFYKTDSRGASTSTSSSSSGSSSSSSSEAGSSSASDSSSSSTTAASAGSSSASPASTTPSSSGTSAS